MSTSVRGSLMLMWLFYARWQFPTLRLKHKNLKKSSNRDVNMYKIQNKSYTYWLYTFKKHVGDYSQLDTPAQLEFHRVWGSEHSGGCLFGLALCPDDIISRETELRTSVRYEEVELGKYFSLTSLHEPTVTDQTNTVHKLHLSCTAEYWQAFAQDQLWV